MAAIKAGINISAAVLVISQAAGPAAPVNHESKSVKEIGKNQTLSGKTTETTFRLAANDRITLVPCKASAVSNSGTTSAISPSTATNSGAGGKLIKTGFRPVHSNRTFLAD